MDLLKNFGFIQKRLQESQEKFRELRSMGSAGGNMVTITISGDFSITDVHIDPESLDPNDIATLQVLIIAAHNDAMIKMKELLNKEMANLGLSAAPNFPTT